MLAVAALAVASCAPRDEPGTPLPEPPDPGRASVLLVTLDTFRGDAWGAGGSPVARTPHLDRLARRGVQWEIGLASCPLTAPSHASMLTGLDPPAHGVRNNATYLLREDVPTLAEALQRNGFETAAFLAAFPLMRKHGFARGFDHYDDDVGAPHAMHTGLMAQRPGSAVVAAAARWLDERTPAARLFVWAHFFDAHQPWDAPGPLVRAAGGSAYLADASVADRAVGSLLRRIALSERPWWIVTIGDHGESLGDHGELTHGIFLYRATMDVPAIVAPAPRGERPGPRRGIFRTLDVPATVFSLLDLDPRGAPGDGTSALGPADGPAYLESLYPYLAYGWSELRGVQHGRWKYVAAPDAELYDLEADPGEVRNVARDHPGEAERLAAVLVELSAETAAPSRLPLDEASRRAIESLGYVARDDEPAGGDLPDPKDMQRVTRSLMDALVAMGSGQWDVAHQALRAAISWDPDNKEAHKSLGVLLAATGRDREAVDAFLHSLSLPPHRDERVARFELASAYLRLGEWADAERHLEILVTEDPLDPAAWSNLGVARIEQGERERARDAWRRALELDPEHEPARDAMRRTASPAGQ
jgi:arylsulfatase A-like enzyme/cytochrome c-type biogenesis protein CcmH/NrfG